MKYLKVCFIILCLFTLFSCSKNSNDLELNKQPEEQEILFEYRNYAWGYTHTGWFVDKNGKIKQYELPNKWNEADEYNYISEDALLQNYKEANTILTEIDKTELAKYSLLIEESIDGNMSEYNCTTEDAGLEYFYCYYWNSNIKKYKKQLLFVDGDCNQYNLSLAASKLVKFLDNIKNNL